MENRSDQRAGQLVVSKTHLPETSGSQQQTQATLQSVLAMAKRRHQAIEEQVHDYRCLLVKRERIGGSLSDFQYMVAKVRHARQSSQGSVPFSVYLRFLAPQDLEGREVLYVEGRHDGKLVAKKGGQRFSYITTELAPDSELALISNRYPITEFGFENLAARLIQLAQRETIQRSCRVRLLPQARIDDRPCLGVEVEQPERMSDAPPEEDFCLARIFIDRELGIPIHYEAYQWPTEKGDPPRLLEQYTYRQVELNVGFGEVDFRRDNPNYGFRSR